MQEQLPVELNVQVFPSEMPPPFSHSHPSPSFLSDRSLSPDFLSLSDAHLERPSLSFQRKGDHYCCRQQPFFLYMHSITVLSFPFHSINLPPSPLARRCNSPGYRLSAYSGGFREPVTYEVPISPLPRCGWKCLPCDRYDPVWKRRQNLLRII